MTRSKFLITTVNVNAECCVHSSAASPVIYSSLASDAHQSLSPLLHAPSWRFCKLLPGISVKLNPFSVECYFLKSTNIFFLHRPFLSFTPPTPCSPTVPCCHLLLMQVAVHVKLHLSAHPPEPFGCTHGNGHGLGECVCNCPWIRTEQGEP
jgi:hypothetical protein